MIKRTIILLVILPSIVCYASETNGSLLYTKVTSTQKIAPFANKFIAYKTSKTSFKGFLYEGQKGKTRCYYGYVSVSTDNTAKPYYQLIKLISAAGTHRNVSFTDEILNNNQSLYMREATLEEVKTLNNAFKKKDLIFSFNSLHATAALQRLVEESKNSSAN